MAWEFAASARVYVDPETGETLGQDGMRDLLGELHDKMGTQFAETANALYDRGASPSEWERELRPLIEETRALGYELARGGENAMGDADWSTLDDLIAQDADFLASFAADAGTGQLSAEEAANRARLYADGARSGYSNGLAAAFDITLPVHPPIHPNCGCQFNITDNAGTIAAYWILGTDNPCPECLAAEAEYSPYVAA